MRSGIQCRLKPQFGHNKASTVRQSARSSEHRGVGHVTRHCVDGVGGSERSMRGQIDVKVICTLEQDIVAIGHLRGGNEWNEK